MSVVRKVFDDYPNEVVFATAAAVRILLALAFPELPDILTGRVEISTPVSSFKRRKSAFLADGLKRTLLTSVRSARRTIPVPEGT